MASPIFSSHVALMMKKNLKGIIKDKSDGMDASMVARQFMRVESMEDAYDDYVPVAGPGLASEKHEGTDIAVGEMFVGLPTRIYARTFAVRILITEETVEDNKYPEVIKAGMACKQAIYNTLNVDATSILVNAWDTSYTGGDALPLFSSSHLLPGGSTYSNNLATPMSPSRSALIVMKSAVRKLPALTGIVQQYLQLKKIVCPVEQESVWEMILGSKMAPEPGNFSAINVTAKWQLEMFANPFWDNTTTNWAALTNCEDPLLLKQRRKPRGANYNNEDAEIMTFKCSDRHGVGWTDPRAAYGSQA